MKRAEITINGLVQGVFFRQTAREMAQRLGITGWVRNEAQARLQAGQGSVRIVAEGSEEALQQLIEWCKKGTGMARVDDVQVEWGDATGEFETFEIT